eukprot:3382494-Amphidinium_carterae.1
MSLAQTQSNPPTGSQRNSSAPPNPKADKPAPTSDRNRGRAKSIPPPVRRNETDSDLLPTFSLVDHQFNVPAVTALLPYADGVAICASKADLLRQVQRFTGSKHNVAVVTPCQYSDISIASEVIPLQFCKSALGHDSKFVASVALYTLAGYVARKADNRVESIQLPASSTCTVRLSFPPDLADPSLGRMADKSDTEGVLAKLQLLESASSEGISKGTFLECFIPPSLA